MRHDPSMDGHALERLGHHIVSGPVALGTGTAPTWPTASSSPCGPSPTSRTECVKPAPAHTPCWKTSSRGHPEASTTSSPAENPKSWWSSCAARAPNLLDTRRTPATPSPAPPPRSCSWSCAAASSDPARDSGRAGTTWMALRRKVIGPRRVSRTSWPPPHGPQRRANVLQLPVAWPTNSGTTVTKKYLVFRDSRGGGYYVASKGLLKG